MVSLLVSKCLFFFMNHRSRQSFALLGHPIFKYYLKARPRKSAWERKVSHLYTLVQAVGNKKEHVRPRRFSISGHHQSSLLLVEPSITYYATAPFYQCWDWLPSPASSHQTLNTRLMTKICMPFLVLSHTDAWPCARIDQAKSCQDMSLIV